MTKVIASVAVGLLLLLGLAGGFLHPGGVQAVAGGPGEKTVTLAVKNMYCAACPSIVKKSLEVVPGVAKATVSYKDKTAVVRTSSCRKVATAFKQLCLLSGRGSRLMISPTRSSRISRQSRV